MSEQPSGQEGASTHGAPIVINGMGTIRGDAVTQAVTVNGSGSVEGHTSAGSVTVNGTGRFARTVQANEFKVSGEATIVEGAGVGRLLVSGRLTVGGSLNVHDCVSKGELTVGGDVQADTFSAEGSLHLNGHLEAKRVDVQLYRESSIRSVRAETISIRKGTGWTGFSLFSDKRLTAETIEGSSVYLENVAVKVVRAGNVTVGPGCRVESVEYTGELSQLEDGWVGQAIRVA